MISALWLDDILGISIPLSLDFTSSIALLSAVVPSLLIATFWAEIIEVVRQRKKTNDKKKCSW